jgi:hypothetical protein
VRPRRLGVDLVALVLALGLSSLVVLILIATIVQILNNNRPEVTLSENATQILTSAVGGLAGILGGYVGYSLRDRRDGVETAQRSSERSGPS